MNIYLLLSWITWSQSCVCLLVGTNHEFLANQSSPNTATTASNTLLLISYYWIIDDIYWGEQETESPQSYKYSVTLFLLSLDWL